MSGSRAPGVVRLLCVCSRARLDPCVCYAASYVVLGPVVFFLRRNFVLTGCSIFHSKYLSLYTHSSDPYMVEGRRLVTQYFNGEDILFSFMHAKETGLGPLVVDAQWDQKLMAGAPGLQKRNNHFSHRATVINRLVAAFGDDMPLKPAVGIHWHNGHPHVINCSTPEKLR